MIRTVRAAAVAGAASHSPPRPRSGRPGAGLGAGVAPHVGYLDLPRRGGRPRQRRDARPSRGAAPARRSSSCSTALSPARAAAALTAARSSIASPAPSISRRAARALEGQLAVAEVVLNRARSGRYPATWCGVVAQRAQFSFVRRGAHPARPTAPPRPGAAPSPSRASPRRECSACSAENVLWYHASYVSPELGPPARPQRPDRRPHLLPLKILLTRRRLVPKLAAMTNAAIQPSFLPPCVRRPGFGGACLPTRRACIDGDGSSRSQPVESHEARRSRRAFSLRSSPSSQDFSPCT